MKEQQPKNDDLVQTKREWTKPELKKSTIHDTYYSAGAPTDGDNSGSLFTH